MSKKKPPYTLSVEFTGYMDLQSRVNNWLTDVHRSSAFPEAQVSGRICCRLPENTSTKAFSVVLLKYPTQTRKHPTMQSHNL